MHLFVSIYLPLYTIDQKTTYIRTKTPIRRRILGKMTIHRYKVQKYL